MTDHTQTNIITLTRHVFETQRLHPEASGDLTLLLNAVQLGCKFVESCVRKSRLVNLIGLAGNQNVQGEDQKKLDVLSNEMFVNAIRASNKVAMMVSEEDEEAIFVEGSDGRYCITFDPLDGSSNIDAGVNVGTIFGIFKLKGSESDAVRAEDILMKGSEIKVAGYCMYGSSCNIVISLGVGVVNGFTLDPALGEFILTHPNIRIPKRGKIYSINEGNSLYWDDATRHYIESLKNGPGGRKPYSARYIGSMVADVHRTLL
ncbi:Fructose-1,6-bisphosphatase, partial [Spiromyces aspiralis]